MRVLSALLITSLLAIVSFDTFAASSGGKPLVDIEHPWTMATPGGATTAAAFMIVHNNQNVSDRLMGGSTPAARSVEVHEMTIVNNVMEMRELGGGLAVPPVASVALKPGSYHIMLLGLIKPLVAGTSIEMTLNFQHAGPISFVVPVQAMGSDTGNTQGQPPAMDGGMKMQ